jgi:hypothetical protein
MYVVACIFYQFFLLLSVAYIYCTWCLEKYTSKIVHINIIIHSSFCVLNFMLPEHRPFFAKVAHTRYKVDLVYRNGFTIVHSSLNL